jgi:hypothetical protein
VGKHRDDRLALLGHFSCFFVQLGTVPGIGDLQKRSVDPSCSATRS